MKLDKYVGFSFLIISIVLAIVFVSGCIQQEVTCDKPYLKGWHRMLPRCE